MTRRRVVWCAALWLLALGCPGKDEKVTVTLTTAQAYAAKVCQAICAPHGVRRFVFGVWGADECECQAERVVTPQPQDGGP